jgi:DUF1009 family protein
MFLSRFLQLNVTSLQLFIHNLLQLNHFLLTFSSQILLDGILIQRILKLALQGFQFLVSKSVEQLMQAETNDYFETGVQPQTQSQTNITFTTAAARYLPIFFVCGS